MGNKILIGKPTFNPLVETDPDKFIFHSDYGTLKYFADGYINLAGSWTTPGQLYDKYVSDGSDDAYVHSGGSIQLTGFISFGEASGDRHAGIKFRNVAIPRNSTINWANVYFIAAGTLTGTTCNARIYGEASANPNSFSSYADFMGRTLTSAYVDWNNVPAWTSGNQYVSPNIKTIIQEIVNRGDWDSGDNLALFFKNNGSSTGARRASYGYEDGYSIVLEIQFIAPGNEVKTFTTAVYHGLGYKPFFVSFIHDPNTSVADSFNFMPVGYSIMTIGSIIADCWVDDNYLHFDVQMRPGLNNNTWNFDYDFYYKLFKNRLGL